MKARRLKNKNTLGLIAAIAALISMPQAAIAKDDCTDAKQLVKALKGFYQADASLKDIINPTFDIKMRSLDGFPKLSGMLYRHEEVTHQFDLAEDGSVLGLEDAAGGLSPDGELCILVDGKTVEDSEDSTAEANVLFTFPYRNQSGTISVSDLREGAKDGSKIMKSLAPTGLGFVVPKMKSVILSPAKTGGEVPVMTFVKDGQNIDGPAPQRLGARQYYHLSDIVKTKADEVVITGDYKLDTNFAFKDKDIQAAEKRRLERLETQKTDTPEPSDISEPAETPSSAPQ